MLFFCVCDRFFSSPFPEEISLQYIYRYADDILLYLSKCGKPIPWGLLSLQSHSSISPWLLEWLYVQSKTTDIVRKETSTLNRKSIMAEMVVEWHISFSLSQKANGLFYHRFINWETYEPILHSGESFSVNHFGAAAADGLLLDMDEELMLWNSNADINTMSIVLYGTCWLWHPCSTAEMVLK